MIAIPISHRFVGNVARFFNHSCSPNLRPIKTACGSSSLTTVCFFALNRIEPGEELTWKYVSGVKSKSGQECYCESENCCGYV